MAMDTGILEMLKRLMSDPPRPPSEPDLEGLGALRDRGGFQKLGANVDPEPADRFYELMARRQKSGKQLLPAEVLEKLAKKHAADEFAEAEANPLPPDDSDEDLDDAEKIAKKPRKPFFSFRS